MLHGAVFSKRAPLAAGGSQGELLSILEKFINPVITACEKFNVKGLT
jgi:hypothetical protein